MVGVSAADSDRSAILVAGIAGLTAGALSMAAGEYVSVSSQRDTERADLDRERQELLESPEDERRELAAIYRNRGLSAALAEKVADELSAGEDQLAVHARDELGLDIHKLANPVQAATVSASSFIAGALVPVLLTAVASKTLRLPLMIAVTLAGLVALGATGAKLGGAPQRRAAIRVLVGGSLALAIALLIGRITGTVL